MGNFENLKVGDEVIHSSSGWAGSRSVEKVSRVTKTAVEVRGGLYRKDSGYRKGGGYSRSRISIATPEIIEEMRIEVRTNQLARKLKDTKWRELPIETLEEVFELLTARQSKGTDNQRGEEQ